LNKQKFFAAVNLYGVPVTLVLAGVILLLNPDSAAILIAKLLGWILSVSGVGYGIYALLGGTRGRAGRILTAVVCLLLGSVLLANPLILARDIGRFLGIMLAVEGGQILHRGSGSRGMGILTLVGAVILVLAPMTASRLVFSLCGLILICIGAGQLLDRGRRKKLEKAEKPDIIDAL